MELQDIAPRRYRNPLTGNMEGEHCTIIGQTGFGKSELLKMFCRFRTDVVIHNGKRSDGWTYARGFVNCEGVNELIDRGDRASNRAMSHPESRWSRKLVYTPSRGELRDRGAQDAFWEWCYNRGNTTIGADELTLITNGQDLPEPMEDTLTGGRERGLEIWGCTQQPVWVPNVQFTQSRALYCFYIAHEAHRKKVASLMPGTDVYMIEDLPKYRFLYYREGMRRIYDRPLHVKINSLRLVG